ncbi:1,4-alpha-glucan branching enzyme GlgB [Chlamydiales bacterium STE3]|nr:1,4-alpha-glucan branching enzyme GlgB [Chlamydiales bacterium STE3]
MSSILHDPHAYLGLHSNREGSNQVIRIYRPNATHLYLEFKQQIVEALRVSEEGFFELEVPNDTTYEDYRIYHQNGLLAHDPYSFLPFIGEMDLYLFGKGVHYQLYNMLGAKWTTHQGIQGVRFAVWAPAAKSVALIADFNHFDPCVNPMRSMGSSGVWELFVPGLQIGEKYKFAITTQDGNVKVKNDPFSFQNEHRPLTASIVANVDDFTWGDQAWMAKRLQADFTQQPINVYEIHAGSWRKDNGNTLNYRELAKQLVPYLKQMGYTHVELMPIQEHPLDESWGYQVSNFYAVTSRYGTPQDFQWFVNYLHERDLGVILDWVPGHFPRDDFSLAYFDGTALFEHEDPRQGYHPHWHTHIFNFGRHEVSNFLLANALYWFDKMHIDGLRVDAVASMLYRDYGREDGDWIPNIYGGRDNLEAIEFFKHLNSKVHEFYPKVLMIAEESTSFAGVTHPVSEGGLGFDMKWNMGWMNDTLRYVSKNMLFRKYHHNDLTFGLLYAFSEKFLLALSHDEVVHGKRSLIAKMPGDIWQKFANMRTLLGYQICQPGKKLLFMGAEIGQWNEWWCKGEIEWFLLSYPTHHGLQQMVADLNLFYLNNPALWEKDFDPSGFSWVDASDTDNSVISYLRMGHSQTLLCIHNFTPNYHSRYYVGLRNVKDIKERFNSDAEQYGGTGKLNPSIEITKDGNGIANGLTVQLAPLATMIFEVNFW